MNALFFLLDTVIYLAMLFIIVYVIMSWLVQFQVINLHNDIVRQIYHSISQIAAYLLSPIRRFMPDLGGIDISPIILLLIIFFLRNLLRNNIYPLFI